MGHGSIMTSIAILGFGVVGGGTADLLTSHQKLFAERIGEEVNIKYILDIRDFPDSPYRDLIVHDYQVILDDPEVKVVAEVIGGKHPAYEFSMKALEAGKSVVSSNKELVATYGDTLLKTAKEHGVRYLFEASVGGGVPIIRPLTVDLAANRILSVSGIMNGTTNYILTRMKRDGVDCATALAEAQKLGYAEADPTADIEGIDVCRKICILTAVAYGKLPEPDKVHTEGISSIRVADIVAAAACDSEIKLLGRAITAENGDLYVMVAPFLVPHACPLSHIEDVYNGIAVVGSAVGEVMFYGKGAGAMPTAGAVVSDILDIVSGRTADDMRSFERAELLPTDFGFFSCPHFLALQGTDENALRVIFGDCQIISGSLENELWVKTSAMTENALAGALSRLESCGAVLASHIRIYE